MTITVVTEPVIDGLPHQGNQMIVVDALIATTTERARSDDFDIPVGA